MSLGLYCGGHVGRDILVADEKGIVYSADAGVTWTRQSDKDLSSVFAARDGLAMWALGRAGILESADGGMNWNHSGSPVSTAPPAQPLTDQESDRENQDSEQEDINVQDQSSNVASIFVSRDLTRAWAVDSDGMVYQAAPGKRYPAVAAARLVRSPLGTARLELRLEHEKAAPCRDLTGALSVVEQGIPIEVSKTLLQRPEDPHTCAFDLNARDLRLRPGDHVQVEVSLQDGNYRRGLRLPELTFEPWRWFKDNEGWLIPAAVVTSAVGALILTCAGLLLVRPLGLLALYRWLKLYALFDHLALNPVVKSLVNLTILPLFVKHRRTLDAWVVRGRDKIEQRFEAEEAVLRSGGYVPLPLRIGDADAGTLIEKPDPELLSKRFSPQRSLLEVVGPGGAGKTTLAVEIARWALAGKQRGGLERWPMLPVLVDEDTTDLFAVVRRKLRSWLDEDVDGDFLEALLRKQRLLVIVDRLSERLQTTQEHVRTIHGSHAVHALLVTARYSIGFEAGGTVVIHPQPLNSGTLLFLMTSLLQAHEHRGIFPSMESQLEIGRRLSRLIRVGGQEIPLTPLLVKLYVSKAIELARRQGSEEELPKSVPEVYFAYLRGVNPQGDGVTNSLSHEEMLQVAEVLGRQAVEKDFAPREFAKSVARTRLAVKGLGGTDRPDGIQRLVSNGVLVEREAGTDMLVRFLLDPVAEFLGAMSWARECAGVPEAWDRLRDQVAERGEQASGFATALALICEAYAEVYAWACGSLQQGERRSDAMRPFSPTPLSNDKK